MQFELILGYGPGMRKISRATAIKRGLPRYFTGKPCRNGHVAARYVSNRSCATCALMAVERYNVTPKGRKAHRRAQATPLGKEAMRRYKASPKGRERNRQFKVSPKGIEGKRRERQSPKGIETRRAYQITPAYRAEKNLRRRDLHLHHMLDPDHEKFNPGRADFLIAKYWREGKT